MRGTISLVAAAVCLAGTFTHYGMADNQRRTLFPYTTLFRSLYDRLIYGGAMPVNKTLKLEVFRELGPEITYFLERRELGVINTCLLYTSLQSLPVGNVILYRSQEVSSISRQEIIVLGIDFISDKGI